MRSLLTLFILTGCSVAHGAAPGPDPDWNQVVARGLRADASAIALRGGAFVAPMPQGDADASFSTEGVRIGRPDGAGVHLSLDAWGGDDEADADGFVAPALGECTGAAGIDGSCVRRLEYRRSPTLREWWVGEEQGVEFGWTVAQAPDAGRSIWFEMNIAGADAVEQAGDGAWVLDADGREWEISPAMAWDADGRILDATSTVVGGVLRIEVDIAGASWPVEVDPVYNATTLSGSGAGTSFGNSVASAGDVNGDGYDDVVVGEPGWDSTSSSTDWGRAYVFLGSASGISTTAATTLTGPAAASLFGYSVAGAGDLNGDGYDDVIVGAPSYSSNAGLALIYLGSAAGLDPTIVNSILGSAGSYTGWSVAAAGDTNGDGLADVIIGAPGTVRSGHSFCGAALLFTGDATTLIDAASAWGSYSPAALSGEFYGYSVAGVGDVDGNGYDDFAVGAYGAESTSADVGKVYVYENTGSGYPSTASVTITGPIAGSKYGFSVAGAGDVNGDGYDDLILGAPFDDSGATDGGFLAVYMGSASGLGTAWAYSLTGTTEGTFLGFSVAGIGDVDRDGYDDIAFGMYGYDNGATSDAGAFFMYPGSAGGVTSTGGTSRVGVHSGEWLGISVAGAGDVNGDGYDDVITGASYGGDYSQTGLAFVREGYADYDLDGWGGGGAESSDCDDADATVNPDAAETPMDGIDQDCDGVDACYVDADGDGYGSTAAVPATTDLCTGVGESPNADDCDDTNADIFPTSAEGVADGVDQDCDGLELCFVDADGDGHRTIDAAATVASTDLDCQGTGEADATQAADDCNDAAPGIHPGAVEVCDTLNTDEDCNGSADNADAGVDPATASVWYQDDDADGYGVTAEATTACDILTGYSALAEDCDDGNAGINPGETELCDDASVDEDCNGAADDLDLGVDRSSYNVWYLDDDGDGAGDVTRLLRQCDQPSRYVSEATDCDDSRDDVHPGAIEVCDGVDDDCDTLIDDADTDVTGQPTWFADTDEDDFGDEAVTGIACVQPPGYVAEGGDCDDDSASTNPDAAEYCGGGDENCDGVVDEGTAVDASSWYLDSDVDGYGDVNEPTTACTQPDGYVADARDCDDAESGTHPGADEYCNEVDDNCNEDIDENTAVDAVVWHLDSDGDTFGDPLTTERACVAPSGFVADGTDCDDTNASVHAGVSEYADADGDGFGDPATESAACTLDVGMVANSDDCDDARGDVNPDAAEICTDEVDNDCANGIDDGCPEWKAAAVYCGCASGDGYGGASALLVAGLALTLRRNHKERK